MWVFCCGMYRSGSTLQFQITSELVTQTGRGIQMGWIDARRFAEVKQEQENKTGLESPCLKVVKVHDCTPAIRAEFEQQNAIGIYSFRDLRDVFVSMMQQQQKSFAQLWQENFIESCLHNHQLWTSLPTVLVSAYEKMIADVPGEVQRIARHLGLNLTETEGQTIAANYNLDKQRTRIARFRAELLQTPLNPEDHRTIFDYHDEKTLLHLNHIHTVKAGRWQDELSDQQADLIAERVRNWYREGASSFRR